MAYLVLLSTNSLLAGLFPIPNSSLDNAALASEVKSLLFLLIVSTPPSSSDTFLAFDVDDSACRLGLALSDRLLGIETGEGGSPNPVTVYWDSGKLSKGLLGLSVIDVIVGIVVVVGRCVWVVYVLQRRDGR
jgi:hypothetical protein